MFGRGRKVLAEVQEGSGGPPERPRGAKRHLQKSGRGREAPAEVPEGSGGPLEGLGRVRRPLRRSGRGRDFLA